MTNASCASWVLEVACGSGLPSTVFISNMMWNGASYFCCDFSDKMVSITWSTINNSLLRADQTFKHVETEFTGKQEIDQ